jgi:hypothetical protein
MELTRLQDQIQDIQAKNVELEVEFKNTCEVNAELRNALSGAEAVCLGDGLGRR